MSIEPSDQEKRSREIADKLRTYLAALNTGGIAVTFGVAGSLANHNVHPPMDGLACRCVRRWLGTSRG